MGRKTGISWTQSTWNPIRGCSRVSEGCRNCYAETMAARFCGEGQPYHGLATRTESGPRWTGEVRVITKHLDDPLRWQRPRQIFVNSMSDLFHGTLTNEEIAAIFGIMAAAERHTFQLLTKRSARMLSWFGWVRGMAASKGTDPVATCLHYAGKLCDHRDLGLAAAKAGSRGEGTKCIPWPLPNVWLGVSAENQEAADERIPDLLKCCADVRWVSVEPMIGPVSLEQYTSPSPTDNDPQSRVVDWVVIGGESGRNARPMSIEWAEDLVAELTRFDVSVFVKQMGANPTRDAFSEYLGEMTTEPLLLAHHSGADMDEWPEQLKVRQWPGCGV